MTLTSDVRGGERIERGKKKCGGGTFGKRGNNVGASDLHWENAETAHVGISNGVLL